MRSVRILQEEIAKETGRPIADFENAYDRENHENSINFDEIEKYLIAKHGLERNVSIGSPQRYPMFSRK